MFENQEVINHEDRKFLKPRLQSHNVKQYHMVHSLMEKLSI